MEKTKTINFKWRGMTTFLLIMALFVDTVSGIILYIVPPGRVTNWTNWTLWGLTKGEWQAIHTIFSYLLLGFVVAHLYFNWRVLVHFFWNKIRQAMNLKKELAIATGIILLVFLGTLWNVQPFSAVMDFGEKMKHGWEQDNAAIGGGGYGRRAHFNNPQSGPVSYAGQGRGYGRRTAERTAEQNASPSTLKGRDIVRLGKLNTLTGNLVRLGDEWGLEAGGKVFEIHMGPSEYRASKGFTLKDSEKAIVRGFVYRQDVAVTTMETGGLTIQLRDESGRPAWSGNGGFRL